MNKILLLKSDHERETIGDIIMNVDKILTIRAYRNAEKSNYWFVVDYTHDDGVGQFYKTEEALRAALKEIVVAMGGEAPLVDAFIIRDYKDTRNAAVSEALDDLKSKLLAG